MASNIPDNDSNLPGALTEALLDATKAEHPSPDRATVMFDRVRQRIRAEREALPPVTEFLTVADAGGEWIEPMPGNRIKMLRADAQTRSFLVRLAPGTRFPAHSHPEDEETLVLDGEVLFGELRLRSGDYHLARKGSSHEEVYSRDGCLLFIRASTQQS